MLSPNGSVQVGAYAARSDHHPHRVRSPHRLLSRRPRPPPIQRRTFSLSLSAILTFQFSIMAFLLVWIGLGWVEDNLQLHLIWGRFSVVRFGASSAFFYVGCWIVWFFILPLLHSSLIDQSIHSSLFVCIYRSRKKRVLITIVFGGVGNLAPALFTTRWLQSF